MGTVLFLGLFICFLLSKFYLNKINTLLRSIISIVITLGVGFLTGYVAGLVVALVALLVQLVFVIDVEVKEDSEEVNTKEPFINLIKLLVINVAAILISIAVVYQIPFLAVRGGTLQIFVDIFTSIDMDPASVFSIVAGLLFICKPSNIIVAGVSGVVVKEQDALLAILERIVYLFCVFNGMTYVLAMLIIVRAAFTYKTLTDENSKVSFIQLLTSILIVLAVSYFL